MRCFASPYMLLYLFLFFTNIFGRLEAAQPCGFDKTACSNNDCIDSELWCDGNVDCADGSDETNDACINMVCPKYLFRCSYGACIAKRLKCNGKNDCRDGSDEAAIECSQLELNSTCPNPLQVRCRSSECIAQEMACDGKKDCTDGSDETVLTCSPKRCLSYSFRCAYGACISKKLVCDGKFDCLDRSDEVNCPKDRMTTLDMGPVSRPTTTEAGIIFGCTVPSAEYLIVIDSNTGEVIAPGTTVNNGGSINYTCSTKTFLIGKVQNNFCVQMWLNPHPKCEKMCEGLWKDVTTRATCEDLNGLSVSCYDYVSVGTIARITCAESYKKPNKQVNENLQCRKGGEWDYSPYKCEQTCGTVDRRRKYSVNSDIAKVQEVPWNVGIYMLKNGKYEHICGGTLVFSKMVISAAHCFWQENNKTAARPELFKIAVGKFYRDYYATNETLSVQTSSVSSINISVHFEGPQHDFSHDICALILTEHIVYQTHIRPACLSWKKQNGKVLSDGIYGIVSGWGITNTGTYSPELRSVELSTLNLGVCRTRITKNQNIANDKFCVETREKKNVCPGDSGGGFLVPEEIDDATYYTLWGIVSNGIAVQKTVEEVCDENFITAFTNIQWYEYFVQQLTLKLD